jgi:hypothetical protein
MPPEGVMRDVVASRYVAIRYHSLKIGLNLMTLGMFADAAFARHAITLEGLRSYFCTVHYFSDTLVISTPATLTWVAPQTAYRRPPTIGRAPVKSLSSWASANMQHRRPIMDEAAFPAERGSRGKLHRHEAASSN